MTGSKAVMFLVGTGCDCVPAQSQSCQALEEDMANLWSSSKVALYALRKSGKWKVGVLCRIHISVPKGAPLRYLGSLASKSGESVTLLIGSKLMV